MDVNKMKFEEVAKSLDPAFLPNESLLGSVRLLAALAEKSQTAQTALLALPQAVIASLNELGITQAAKDVEADPDILAVLDPIAEEGNGSEPDGELADALEQVAEATKAVNARIDGIATRLEAMEKAKGMSFARDLGEHVTVKSGNGDSLWAGSAFDL